MVSPAVWETVGILAVSAVLLRWSLQEVVLEKPASATKQPRDQDILKLVYLAEESRAFQDVYVHRGVSCDGCGKSPIVGFRYHCTECVDIDLCHLCEHRQVHDPAHIMIKIRVPIPLVKSPRWIRPVGRQQEIATLSSVPEEVMAWLMEQTTLSRHRIEALHRRFRLIADVVIDSGDSGVGPDLPYAISRHTFERLVVPVDTPEPCLYAQRMTRLYMGSRHDAVSFASFVSTFFTINREPSRMFCVFNLFTKAQSPDYAYYDEAKAVVRSFTEVMALYEAVVADAATIGAAINIDNAVQMNHHMHARPLSTFFSENALARQASYLGSHHKWPLFPLKRDESLIDRLEARLPVARPIDDSPFSALFKRGFGSQNAMYLLPYMQVTMEESLEMMWPVENHQRIRMSPKSWSSEDINRLYDCVFSSKLAPALLYSFI